MTQLASPRNLHPADMHKYHVEKRYPSGQWLKVAFAISTADADRIIAQKMRFESGKFRAIRAA